MSWLCLALLACCGILFVKLRIREHQIKAIKQQIDFICSRDTQAEIRLEKLDNSLEQLAAGINLLLDKYRSTGRQIEKNDSLFKDTITSLSHDLRTPLATANGYIQLLMEQDLTAEQREYTEIANERVSAVKLLLDQLFELARIEANELTLHNQNTDGNSVLRDVLAAYFSDFEKKGVIPDIAIPNIPVMIWADQNALSRIFSNVIYNALLHGEGESKICSSVIGNEYSIVISNRSETIKKEDIPHLFDRFYTTDQSRTKKTTGLGLAIARNLTSRMGGNISACLQNETFEIHISFTVI